MKLGRKPADPAALARAPQLRHRMMAAAPPPPTLDRSRIPFSPNLDRNDELSDCSAVGIANAARAAAELNGFGIAISTSDVVAFYSESCGYDPADPSTDQGGVLLDVLSYQIKHGFRRVGNDALVGSFGTFDPKDRMMMAKAMARCGTAYLGISLASADMDNGATDPVVLWDTATPGDQTPRPDLGHCLFAFDYTGLGDTDTVRLGTWGCWKRATWRWIESRTEEAHAIIFRQLMKTTGTNFDGRDYAELHDANMRWIG